MTSRSLLLAVAGNPNCGKTTLFNALTGLRQKVGNYPGVTVEKREGVMSGDSRIRLLDLPGTYSLAARSPDEEISRDVLLGHVAGTERPDGVLVVTDAGNLERHLYLAAQIIELGLPVVVACNMMDSLRAAGGELDVDALAAKLGVPVVPTVAHTGEGLEALRAALTDLVERRPTPLVRRPWSLPERLQREVEALADTLRRHEYVEGRAAQATALLMLSQGRPFDSCILPSTVHEAVRDAFDRLETDGVADPSYEITTARYGWLGELLGDCLRRSANATSHTLTDRLDRVLTHRIAGMLAFGAIMALLFYSIFAVADPMMGAIEDGVTALQTWAGARMTPGLLRDLTLEGLIAGVGNVVVFFPQICILFLFIALLEDTGYMARAAFLMDRYMTPFGLSGKSFIPLLSCHACAVPGIMATRTIEHPKDRLATILVAPLMSCSARLPVYSVLIAACLPGGAWLKAGVLISLYALGIVMALAVAVMLRLTVTRGPRPAFIIELPPYHRPRLGAVLRVVWDRGKTFLVRAGTIILALTIVMWVLLNVPRRSPETARLEAARTALVSTEPPPADLESRLAELDQQEQTALLHHSLAGRFGRFIEPAIQPLGYDWKIGIGIISSFAAREVFVSTMATVYSVGDADDEAKGLRDYMKAATRPDGTRLYTPLTALSLMVFYALACQCASTLAVVRRETNSWRWPVVMFGYLTVLAYVGALAVYQVGSALHLGVG